MVHTLSACAWSPEFAKQWKYMCTCIYCTTVCINLAKLAENDIGEFMIWWMALQPQDAVRRCSSCMCFCNGDSAHVHVTQCEQFFVWQWHCNCQITTKVSRYTVHRFQALCGEGGLRTGKYRRLLPNFAEPSDHTPQVSFAGSSTGWLLPGILGIPSHS